jgi:Fe2+ or Zn2+ uptake regulation protein
MKKTCDLALPSIMRALKTLEELGIVKEITGKERHKVFV